MSAMMHGCRKQGTEVAARFAFPHVLERCNRVAKKIAVSARQAMAQM